MGHGLGRRETPAKAANYFAENKRKVPDLLRNQELFGGDYWTRTSDLLRVKSLKNGVDVKTLSSALGHYSAGFTLSTCTHATADMKRDAADTIGSVISRAM